MSGSILVVMIILFITFVCVRFHYVKRHSNTHGNTNSNVANVSSDSGVSPCSSRSPGHILTAVRYAKKHDLTSPAHFDDTESLPEYTPSTPPPDYSSSEVLEPAIHNIVL